MNGLKTKPGSWVRASALKRLPASEVRRGHSPTQAGVLALSPGGEQRGGCLQVTGHFWGQFPPL